MNKLYSLSMRFCALLQILLCFNVVTARPGNKCSQPKETGPCRMSFISFYYNTNTDRCESFYFGGCRGNDNNFKSLADCQKECHSSSYNPSSSELNPSVKSEHCQSEAVAGQIFCAGYFHKFTFNYDTLTCEPYVYGGCGATANLYDTLQECMSSCVHGQVGASVTEKTIPVSFFRSAPTGGAPMESRQDKDAIIFPQWKEEEDICDLPPVHKGPIMCAAYIEKWTYDKKRGKCVQFIHGGCFGTKNNFASKADCENSCPKTPSRSTKPPQFIRPDFCSLPAVDNEGGIQCLALSYGYTFNGAKGSCEQIVYGGCGATANYFSSLQKCKSACEGEGNGSQKFIDVCTLPTEAGKCRARKPKYTFNQETQRCEKFFYTGCEGNGNRFDSVEECFDTCGGADPEQNAFCSKIKCDKNDIDFHTAKACIPLTKKGECCPSGWDCSFWENERLKRLDECFHVSPNYPHGKFYQIGEQIKDLGEGHCFGGSYCAREEDGNALPTVSVGMCGRPQFSPTEDCIQTYNSTHQCCSERHACGADKHRLQTCSFEGKKYHDGEKMYSEHNPCLTCLCTSNFNEAHLEEFCTEIKCRYLTESDKLIKNCLPVHRPDSCCPIDWICPTVQPTINPHILITPLGPNDPSQIQIDPPFFFGGSNENSQVPTKHDEKCPPGVEIEPSYVSNPLVVSPETLSSISLPFSSSFQKHSPASVGAQGKSHDDCLLPPAVGPCKGFRDKFFFNIDNRKCTAFKYGGFDEDAQGFNVFKSKGECEKVCERLLPSKEIPKPVLQQQQVDSECVTPLHHGITSGQLCLPLARRYRYDLSKDRCEPYTTGLCKPGPNRFSTQQECELKCVQSPPRIDLTKDNIPGLLPKCNLNVIPGNCRSRIKRYFYSPAHGGCRFFYYTGCQGNENNFLTAEKCEKACVPSTEVRSSFQVATEPNEIVEEIKNPCDQPKNSGLCKAMKPSYYFDKDEGVCKFFLYGGCMGNANRFFTLKECSLTCEVTIEKQSEGNYCKKAPEPGPCFAIIRKWYYDPKENDCKLFFYGGCAGNGNKFDSKQECELTCSSDFDIPQGRIKDKNIPNPVIDDSILSTGMVDPCLLDKTIGDCRAALNKFYFDKESKECKLFKYGGCNGNGNNFPSEDICKQVCSSHIQVPVRSNEPPKTVTTEEGDEVAFSPNCFSPVDVGVCRGSKIRHHFNAASGLCEKFIYGGCLGNENNFLSEEECYDTCLPNLVHSQTDLKHKVDAKIHEGEFCHFGNQTFNLGDSLKLNEDSCTSCTCSSPPNLSCSTQKCPLIITPVNTEGCTPKFDEDGCCQIGYDCNDIVKPCSERACLSKKFNVPEGQTCKTIKDKDGCCTLSIFCVPKENLVRDF